MECPVNLTQVIGASLKHFLQGVISVELRGLLGRSVCKPGITAGLSKYCTWTKNLLFLSLWLTGMYNVRSSASSLRALCVRPWKLMLKHCAGQWSARRAKQHREFRPWRLLSSPPAILCAAQGSGLSHTALCSLWCVHSAPPRFVSASCFHFPAFYSIWRVMRSFLHPTRRSWLCSKELQVWSCSPASHLFSYTAQSLAGDKHCVVPAGTGCCSDHPCPWSRSKVSHIDEQHLLPERCSPRERSPGETHVRRTHPCGIIITILFGGESKPITKP